MFELCSWAKDTLAEKNGTSDTPQPKLNYDSDGHVAYVIEQVSDEGHVGPGWDIETLQDLHFSKTDFEDLFRENNIFFAKVRTHIMHPGGNNQSMFYWHGAYTDMGAEKTVIGLNQAKAYCRFSKVSFEPRRTNCRFRFGTDLRNSVGCIPNRIVL